ncbi:hypothetical protein GCM10010399_85790 [Dactylosporangium fulvum]
MAGELLDLDIDLESKDDDESHLIGQLDAALNSYADILEAPRIESQHIDLSDFTSTLEVHIAALLAYKNQEGAQDFTQSRTSVFSALLARERQRWESYLPKHKLQGLHSTVARQLVAITSLLRPRLADLPAIIEAVPTVSTVDDRSKAAFWLQDMFATPSGVLEAIGPDLLVARLLETTPQLSALIESVNSSSELNAQYRDRMFHLLSMASETEQEVRTATAAFVTANLVFLTRELVQQPAEVRFMYSLRAALSVCAPSETLASQAERARAEIPDDRDNRFAFILEALSAVIVEDRRRLFTTKIDAVAQSTLASPTGRRYHKFSVELLNYGRYLGYVSQWPRAFAVTAEAAEICRALHDAAEQIGDLGNLAIALSHCGNYVNQCRMHDEGVRVGRAAIRVWRRLASINEIYYFDLGISLRNLGRALCSSGQAAQAVRVAQESVSVGRRAIEIERRRATGRYERAQNELSGALADLAHHLMDIGNFRGAIDAIRKADSIEARLGTQPKLPDGSTVSSNSYALTQLALRQKRFNDAIELATVTVKLNAMSYVENPGRFYAVRHSLEMLMEALEGAQQYDEAQGVREQWNDFLIETTTEQYRETHGEIRQDDIDRLLRAAI